MASNLGPEVTHLIADHPRPSRHQASRFIRSSLLSYLSIGGCILDNRNDGKSTPFATRCGSVEEQVASAQRGVSTRLSRTPSKRIAAYNITGAPWGHSWVPCKCSATHPSSSSTASPVWAHSKKRHATPAASAASGCCRKAFVGS